MNDQSIIRYDLRDRLEQVRVLADQGGIPIRRKDTTLYRLLASCLAVCEIVTREGREGELRQLLKVSIDQRNPEIWGSGRKAGNNGKGRRYAEHRSDAYILVCRYVLPSTETTAARSRYSSAIREAAKRQISSAALAEWLAENGGVNTLFKARPVIADSVTTRTIHLNCAVTCPKKGRIVVTLEMDHRGFFDVIEVSA